MKKHIIIIVLVLHLFVTGIHAQRINSTINSGWRFQQGDINGPVEMLNTSDWQTINLPHTWNDRDAFDEIPGYYRGVGWYVKELEVPLEWKGKSVVIKFEGANQKAEVYLNGTLLGSHTGGYTAFCFDMTDGLKYGEVNVIAVKLNNAHDENIPPLSADFTFFGGIYRNVRLIVAESVHFDLSNHASDGVFVETPVVSEQNASVTVRGTLVNNSSVSRNVIVETSVLDKNRQVIATKSSKETLPPQSKREFSLEGLEIVAPELWSPDSPYLYQTVTRIKGNDRAATVLDEIDIPVGLRWYAFDEGNGFRLNGKPLKLIGANRHQDFENLGNALSDDYHRNDYEKIKELGFNFVRLAHYPQAPEVYRTCDELGLLVWSEIPVVSSVTRTEEFTRNCLDMQLEHIRQTYNHPCVVFYGYMNEILISLQYQRFSDEERQQAVDDILGLARQLEDLTKAEAPGRYTVMAMHNATTYNESGITEIPDVVGWNLYFGWYYEGISDLTRFLSEQHATHPDQKIIVSEYGPGADVRIHASAPHVQDFSEDYQFLLHASYLKQMMDLHYVAGFAAWNFADFGSSGRADAIPNLNQKGLVNYDRSEKDVCGLYRAYFLDEQVVYIASRNYAKRTGIEQSQGAGFSMDSIKIFTNQERIGLSLNGKALDQKEVRDYIVSFAVPFVDGENLLVATGEKGASDQLVIDYTLVPFHLESQGVKDLAVNVGADVSFYDPGTEVMWIPDRGYEKGSWGYTGGAPYTVQGRQLRTGISQDIKGTDCNPLFQTFVEGITGYRFDVPDGVYSITLCFVEYVSRSRQNYLMFDLSAGDSTESAEESRVFDVSINGTKVLDNLNLERDYGSLQAVTFDFRVQAENDNGIQVDLSPIAGEALLSGIRIRNLNR